MFSNQLKVQSLLKQYEYVYILLPLWAVARSRIKATHWKEHLFQPYQDLTWWRIYKMLRFTLDWILDTH